MNSDLLINDPGFQEAVRQVVPPAWASYTPLVMLLLMFSGRAFQSLKENGGVIGIFKAIFLGVTKPPTQLVILSFFLLTSCAQIQSWVKSPTGQVVVHTSEEVLKATAHAMEPALLEQAILKAEASRRAALLHPATDLPSQLTRAAEVAVWTTAISKAQERYLKLTGSTFTPGKNPVL